MVTAPFSHILPAGPHSSPVGRYGPVPCAASAARHRTALDKYPRMPHDEERGDFSGHMVCRPSRPFRPLQADTMNNIRHSLSALLCLLVTAALAGGCSFKNTGYQNGRYRGTKAYTVRGKTYHPLQSARDFVETGVASWYGPGFHGKTTSNGERYNQNAMTAAHKLLPFGTRLRVVNLENGRTTEVRVNDRGPFVDSRIIDLSRAAAKDLGMLGKGTARVRIVSLERSGEPSIFTPDGDMLGLFYVQIGSFRERPRAVNLADFMRTQGYGCRIARHDGNDLNFVQLGPYHSRSIAERTARSLSLTYRGLFVIAE